MSMTYSRARNVLVLDSELQQIPVEVSSQDLLVRASCCGWMRRVWTLLEGSLGAPRLCVQFLGGFLPIVDTKKRLLRNWSAKSHVIESIGVDAGIFHDTLNTIRQAFLALASSRDQSQAFGHALHGFVGRSTSWRGDELTCLAILLGFNASALTSLQETAVEERDHKLLTLLPNIPHGLLFCPGPKYQYPGYRWMPRDFWRSRPWMYYRPARLRHIIGLEVTLPGFVLSPMSLPQGCFMFQNVKTQKWYKATYDSSFANSFTNHDLLAAHDYVPEESKLGIVCPTMNVTRSGPREIDHIPAALVSITKESNMTMNILDIGRTAKYSTYICYMMITLPEIEEVEQEKAKHGESWQRHMGQASRAAVYVGETLRGKLGLDFLSDSKEEWLDQTWYIS